MTPKRIQMTRHRPWRAENPDAVIVSRPSRWGNPFAVGSVLLWPLEGGSPLQVKVTTREDAVRLFRNWLEGGPSWSPYLGINEPPMELSALRGRDLACWCPLDQPCHADVLLELANKEGSTT